MLLLLLILWKPSRYWVMYVSFYLIKFCKIEILSTILLVLFRAKFACILAISNTVFRWESCKGSVWESVKICSRLCKEERTHDWISRVAHGLQAARSCTHVKHARSWSVIPVVALQDKSPRLTKPLARNLNSRLSQVVRPSRQPALFLKEKKKNWLFTFLTYPTINTLIPTKCGVAIQKEKP